MKVSECFNQTKSKVEYYDDKIQTFGDDMLSLNTMSGQERI